MGHGQDQNQQGSGGQGQPGGTLMEMSIETSGASTDSIDPSKFEVPAGFQQVDYKEPGARRR
jgi:hypothetical protein